MPLRLELDQPSRRRRDRTSRAVLDQRLLEPGDQAAARRDRQAFESLVVAQAGLAVRGDLKFLRILDHAGDDAVVVTCRIAGCHTSPSRT